MTALIIPNGILIETEAATHIFASLLCRDQAYDQMVKIWDLRKKASSITPSIAIPAEASAHDADDEENHNDMTSVVLPAAANDNHDDLALPNDTTILAASSPDSAIMLNTPPLLITDKDSFEQHQKDLIEQQRLQKAAASLEEEIENDKEQVGITKEAGVDTSHSSPGHDTTLNGAAREKDTFLATKLEEQQRPRAASDSNTTPADTSVLTKPRTTTNGTSRLNLTASPALAMNNTLSQGKKPMKVVPLKKSRVCPCTINNEQYHHVALNEIYTGTVEAMFKLLCDSDFLRNFLERYEAFEDVQDGEWRHGRREVTGKRRVKSATSGTKIVKVLFQEKKAHRKFPYYCCITATKSMPDMPMDAIYSIQSRTCITRVHRDKVHVLLTFQVAFTQSNFTSSIIEKNAAADQFRLYNRLNAVLHRPDLIQELLAKDPNSDYILHSLQIPTKAEEEQRINAIEKRKWSYILCIGLIAILLTHSMLAFRLRRIVRHIEVIKAPSQHPYQKPISAPVEHKPSFHDEHSLFDGNIEEVQWVDSQLKQIEKRLSFLQSEASAYNERLRSLKQEFD
ncbi:hypothetical protein BDF20DRAFT_667193 [Mycotypha africana]|uniref:uncharacterized protein n=1 Tax=Mycotypha africana TaxID=64632 RepID=UPI002301ABE2|nr:uncharacterized protein BDF20DRAFT_667193 [Mycotypha africana]KAI8973698.1 hypothetical protein BDF20DRAFT_667193 [Mycotypha africana]